MIPFMLIPTVNGEIDLREFAQQMLDHFGTLEEQEMAVKEAFQRLDKDGNGYIDYEEPRSVLQEKGEAPLTEEEFQKLVEEIDVNQDGKIDYEGKIQILYSPSFTTRKVSRNR